MTQSILERIHPDFGPLLAALAEGPTFEQMSVEEARAAYKALQPPAADVDVGSIKDAQIPGPAGPLAIRTFAPASPGPHPGIVHFHGGGFVIGDLDTHDGQCRFLCKHADAVVIAIDYRLAPEHLLPAAHEDCLAALRHVMANAADFGVDPARIGVTGDSAGGNLSAFCGVQARNEGLPLKAQMPVVPAVDRGIDSEARRANWATRENPLLSIATVEWFAQHSMPDRSILDDIRLSPLLEPDLSGLAPAIIVPAEVDILHDEGVDYAKRITAAGGRAEVIEGEGMIHPFFSMPHMIPAAAKIVTDAATRFGALLRE
ncbi:MAG: alpha/beta hydrolase [Pseudomonadota bacterium]